MHKSLQSNAPCRRVGARLSGAASYPHHRSCGGLSCAARTQWLDCCGHSAGGQHHASCQSACSARHSGNRCSSRRVVRTRQAAWAARPALALASSVVGPPEREQLPTTQWHASELQAFLNSIPYKRLLVWAAVSAFAYQMQDFFGIAMGVFIISFIGNSFATGSQDSQVVAWVSSDRAARRRFLVVLYFLCIVAFVGLFGLLTIPDIAREGADFVQRLRSDNIWVLLVEKARVGVGEQMMESLERLVLLATSKDITLAAADPGRAWTAERSQALGLAVSGMLKGYTTTAATLTAGMLKSVTKFALQVGISLVLSFMLVWDMPAISRGIQRLRDSRLAPIYDELAPAMNGFGKLFGRALEAQAKIALVNTALTAAGMWLLDIPGIGLLSLFVCVCSCIPIAGCIISTVPIGFVALTEYGFFKLALVILMVILVHFVEGYILNPAIYSAHLKLHPLMVLSVLVVAEHNMGIWGLLVAVPLTVFALDYLVKYPSEAKAQAQEVPAAAPQASSAAAAVAPPVDVYAAGRLKQLG